MASIYSFKVSNQEVIEKFFLGGGSTKKCDHDCDQALIKSSWRSEKHRREKQPVLGLGNINTRKRCEICSELTTKSPERRH